MGVTNDIHWLDGLIYVVLLLGVYGIYRLYVAWMRHREIQKILDQDKDPYDWMKDEDEWEW